MCLGRGELVGLASGQLLEPGGEHRIGALGTPDRAPRRQTHAGAFRGERQWAHRGADRPSSSSRALARTSGTRPGGRPGRPGPRPDRRIPLTAAAALVWSGDLRRLLQQVLFDTAGSVLF